MNIILCVDPNDRSLSLGSMTSFLASLSPDQPRIEAVYVAGRQERKRNLIDLPHAEAQLKKVLSISPQISTPSVLWEDSGSHAAQIEELLNHAISREASMVAVYSHGKRGVERLYLGSFSESLVTLSPLPVLVAKPSTRFPKKTRRVLFATDFSLSAAKAYAELLRLAGDKGWEIVVMHATDPFQQEEHTNSRHYFSQLNRNKERISKMAREKGLDVLVVLDNRFFPVAKLIQNAVDEYGCDLLAVTAQRRPGKHVLLGSITRQLIRDCECPILVLKA